MAESISSAAFGNNKFLQAIQMVNDLVNLSFQMAAVTIIFFALGMYKPQWPLFFMKEPTRVTILMIMPVLIMITVTLFGEGTKREKEKKALAENPVKTVEPAPVPVPMPEAPAAGKVEAK